MWPTSIPTRSSFFRPRYFSVLLAVIVGAWGCSKSKSDAPSTPLGYPYLTNLGADLETSDSLNSAVQSQLRTKLLGAITNRKWSKLTDTFDADFQGRWPGESDWTKATEPWMNHLSQKSISSIVRRAEFGQRIKNTFVEWASFEKAEWRTFDIRYQKNEKSPATAALVAQKVHLLLTGRKNATTKVVLRGTLHILTQIDGEKISVKRLDADALSISTSTTPGFVDLSSQAGFDHFISATDRANIQQLINERELTATGGISILDFEEDGYLDLLVSHPMRGATLFVNDRQGGFTRASPKIFQKGNEPAKFFLWLDFDNDGHSELVSTRPGLYSTKGGKITPIANALTRTPEDDAIKNPNYEGLTSCDLNNDGLLDFIVAGYSHEDSPKNFNNVDSHAGLRNLVFINQGDLKFEEQGRTLGISETRYTFVGECYDFDNDGDLDLYFGNDYGPNEYYENLGSLKFAYKPNHPLATGTSFSMGLSIADFDNTGDKWLSVSNMYSHAGSRIVPYAEELSPAMKKTLNKLAAGNTLYKISDSKFPEQAQTYGVDVSDWAWGNVFFDVDNDGDKDLYVVNGYTSHEDAKAPDF